MSDIPREKNHVLASILRISMFFYAFAMLFPPIWKFGIVRLFITPDMSYREQWFLEDMHFLGSIEVFISVAFLFVLILVLSFFCRVSHPRLARGGFILLPGSLLYLAIMLPAISRAREKPIIYLYPLVETTVNVKVHYNGVLTQSIPAYPDNGWTVIASPSGELTDPSTGGEYPYLFWEGIDAHNYAMPDGFVVAGSQTSVFLDQALSNLGLSSKEIADFTEYWLPRMTPHHYNFIHFATDEYNRQVPLDVTPKPDTLIRVFMLFRALDAPMTVKPQRLTKTERRGFTVVEWGGTELKRWQFTRR